MSHTYILNDLFVVDHVIEDLIKDVVDLVADLRRDVIKVQNAPDDDGIVVAHLLASTEATLTDLQQALGRLVKDCVDALAVRIVVLVLSELENIGGKRVAHVISNDIHHSGNILMNVTTGLWIASYVLQDDIIVRQHDIAGRSGGTSRRSQRRRQGPLHGAMEYALLLCCCLDLLRLDLFSMQVDLRFVRKCQMNLRTRTRTTPRMRNAFAF